MHYTQLEVWQHAMDLVADVYRETAELPSNERFGLQAQMRRAAVSILSNIAEGEGRRGCRDHARFLLTARGSLLEVETQVRICERLGYLDVSVVAQLLRKGADVGKLITGTRRSLSRNAADS